MKSYSSDILQGLSPESRLLHQQWDLLRMQHGKLWRVFVAANGTIDNSLWYHNHFEIKFCMSFMMAHLEDIWEKTKCIVN